MHGLDVIIATNAKAAGREAAHARNDGNHRKANRILSASLEESKRLPAGSEIEHIECIAYLAGEDAGRQEG